MFACASASSRFAQLKLDTVLRGQEMNCSELTTPSAGMLATSENDVEALKRRPNGIANGNGLPPAVSVPKVVVAVEKEREKLLNATGDFCGGRGGGLGRRLEAWLYVSGDADGRVGLGRRWEGEGEEGVGRLGNPFQA